MLTKFLQLNLKKAHLKELCKWMNFDSVDAGKTECDCLKISYVFFVLF